MQRSVTAFSTWLVNRGIERIVFVDDQRQHHAIEAGAPVRQFLPGHLAAAELKAIRRQQYPEFKRS